MNPELLPLPLLQPERQGSPESFPAAPEGNEQPAPRGEVLNPGFAIKKRLSS